MIFDNTTLIICGILILLSVLTTFCNPFFRWKVNKNHDCNSGAKASIPRQENEHFAALLLFIRNGDAKYLDKNLPILLAQEYDGEYQIVVITEEGDSESADILKRYSGDNRLYSTYIPNSSRYMSRNKLAITLGVKAAKYEWIVLLDAFCAPISTKWLTTISSRFNGDYNLVIAYSGYDEDTKRYYKFDRLRTFCYLARAARHGSAYAVNGSNLAFRKSDFMRENGYQGNLDLIRGEYDFIVNKYSMWKRTAIELSPEAWARDSTPSKRAWLNKQLFYLETRKHLKRSFKHRALYNFDMLLMYVNYAAIVAALVYSIPLRYWPVTAAACLALIITVTIRTILAKRVIKQFDERISVWAIVPYEISVIWHTLANFIRYRHANKYDFTSHKL